MYNVKKHNESLYYLASLDAVSITLRNFLMPQYLRRWELEIYTSMQRESQPKIF